MADYDLIVIGSGPAGEKGATQAAYFGYRVAVVDRAERPGGAPVNSGGIPTKTLRDTAEYLTGFRRREIYGIGMDLSPVIALERLRARAAEVQTTVGEKVRANLVRHGIDLIRGEARLGPDHTVVVTSPPGTARTLAADVILIATGSRPFRPPTVPFDDPDVQDSETILDVDRIPSSLAIIGAGPVGCEYASIGTALGIPVTLIDGADRLMPFLDREISALVSDIFTRMGMRVLTSAGNARVVRVDGVLTVSFESSEELRPEQVLFAAGRVGNTEGLGVSEAGVRCDERRRVVVDDQFRTSVPWIFAAGDVIGPPALGSVSAEQGRVAACHAFGIPFKETVDELPPYGIYAIPEVAMVGMTEEAALGAGIDHAVGRAWFEDNARSRIAGTTEGLLKVVVARDDRRLLGVHIVGDDAAELIHQGQVAIHAGMAVDQFIHATFNIPTRSEAYKYAAYDALRAIHGDPRQATADAAQRQSISTTSTG
jgi:NAD(P) transhydrogenase